MNKELIERMKNNRVPNFLLTDEEWECLEECSDGKWLRDYWNETLGLGSRTSSITYRIHPDWEPEKEVKKIKIPITTFQEMYEVGGRFAAEMVDHVRFLYYELEDGTRLYDMPYFILNDGTREVAKYVVLRKEEQ